MQLPGIDSSKDGMLFVVPTDDEDNLNVAAAAPGRRAGMYLCFSQCACVIVCVRVCVCVCVLRGGGGRGGGGGCRLLPRHTLLSLLPPQEEAKELSSGAHAHCKTYTPPNAPS